MAVYLFVCKRWFKDMVKRASWLKTALYVKCCSVSLMRAYGGCWDRHESLPHPISLARLERPRVIPNFQRRLIRRHDARADRLVKMYLSMFSVSKLVLVPKQSNYQFSSIVDDPSRRQTSRVFWRSTAS